MADTKKTSMSGIAGILGAAGALALAGCGGGGEAAPAAPAAPVVTLPVNALPAGVTQHSITVYSATTVGAGTTAATQDLLTAGLGKTGMGAGAAPAYVDPANPTVLELRRNGLWANYRAVLDPTANGGFGTLYGPNLTADGTVTTSEGLIPGREYFASLDDGSGKKRVVMAVQIPDSFDAARPCIVLGPSSGSRGVYGAIGTSGEWALKRGCAVALTDAGKGMGLYDPMDDTVNKLDGTRATRTAAGALSHFASDMTTAALSAFNILLPNRLALKQVHSQQNPEKDWGPDTLVAARYALYALNDRFGTAANPVPITSANSIIIAGSVSNGGAAVIRAGELDTDGLIDGVVAGEPVTQVPTASGYGITFGGASTVGYGKQLADFVTYANLYQPCAALAAAAAMGEATVFNYMPTFGLSVRAASRCDSLFDKGLVSGADTAARSADSLAKLRAYGWTPEHDQMHNAHYGLGNAAILSTMYPIAYGRFSLAETICNSSFGAADGAGNLVAITATAKAQSFATGNGTANGTPVSVIFNNAGGGAKTWAVAVSPSTGRADFGLDNALCQRALVTGQDPVTSAVLTTATTPTQAQSDAVRAGIAEVVVNGNLRGKPTVIVAGRSDALVPVNNNARAYVALNRVVEGASTKVSYVEVTNAQHFDAFNSFSGFDTRFVPLHVYFNRAMDAMWAHLTSGTALPPSQVVRGTPRGGTPGAAPAIAGANVPAASGSPAGGNQIGFVGTSLIIPN